MLDTTTTQRPLSLQAWRRRVALHKKLRLWEHADFSAPPTHKAKVYWHGTPIRHLDSVLEHGLLPEKTHKYGKVCLSTQAHASLYWARIDVFILRRIPSEVALIRVPGDMLDESLFDIEHGSIHNDAYGKRNPDLRAREKAHSPEEILGSWSVFQGIYGAIQTAQTIPVTPDMVFRVPVDPKGFCYDLLLKESDSGVPGPAPRSTPVPAPAPRRARAASTSGNRALVAA